MTRGREDEESRTGTSTETSRKEGKGLVIVGEYCTGGKEEIFERDLRGSGRP